MLQHPIAVYVNWSAYDELSDDVPLTEELAMRQLRELLRLRGQGCRFDYYLMDCFWYAPDGGYRTWRTPHWPDGPGRWLDACAASGVKPGLWVGTNSCGRWMGLDVHDAWRESVDPTTGHLCLFRGPFLAHLVETLSQYYARGVRLYKFDFANLAAATPDARRTMLPSEVRHAGAEALRSALLAFRQAHPEVVLIAYNGLEEVPAQSRTDWPLQKVIDLRWLECFDSVYCGDPRPADVPAANFWRAKDVYSDHQVRYYHFNGYPLSRIDNAGFMIGTTGTCYHRGKTAWQGMLLLSLARGGWCNTHYGNLDLLTDADARWFAKAQAVYLPLQHARTWAFGGLPGEGAAYGFASVDRDGDRGLITVVNPAQRVGTLAIPRPRDRPARVLFTDAGAAPQLTDDAVRLGPEQMAVVGIGALADERYDLGVGGDVHIPGGIDPLDAAFAPDGPKAVTASIWPPPRGRLRVILRQTDPAGRAKRTTGGAPPTGVPLGQLLRIEATQARTPVPVRVAYDKPIWSGLSWAVGEIDVTTLAGDSPVVIRCSSKEKDDVRLTAQVLHVT